MPIETYKCLIFRGSSPIWIHGIRITRCIVTGRLSKQQQAISGKRERTFGELANGLCEWLLFWKPTNDNAACNSNLKAMNSDQWRTAED
jgi:hypothetical protein